MVSRFYEAEDFTPIMMDEAAASRLGVTTPSYDGHSAAVISTGGFILGELAYLRA